MPWTAKDAARHTKSARTAKQKRQWMHVSNAVLAKTGDEGKAVRVANSVVSRSDRANYGLDSVRRSA